MTIIAHALSATRRGRGVAAARACASSIVERAFRYAENYPIPALLGGAELLAYFRDQTAAREPNIVKDQLPVIGASDPTLIEHEKGDGDA
jgi:hypothetical protein